MTSAPRLESLTATEAAARIRASQLSPVGLLEALLVRIEAVEATVKAWVYIDRARALRLTQEQSAEAAAGVFRGLLVPQTAGSCVDTFSQTSQRRSAHTNLGRHGR